MRAGRRGITPAAIVVIALLLLAGTAAILMPKGGPGASVFPFTVTGMQILSLGNVQIQSNNAGLNGSAFIVLAQAGGGNDQLTGVQTAGRRYAPSDLNSIISSLTQDKVSSGFNIAVDSFDMDCRYPINSYAGYDTYTIRGVPNTGLNINTGTCDVAHLQAAGLTCPGQTVFGYYPGISQSYCVYKCLDGTYGRLALTPDQLWSVKTTLSPDVGSPISVTLSNAGQTSGNFGNYGNVKLQGGAISGFSCSSTANKVGVFVPTATRVPILVQDDLYTAANALNIGQSTYPRTSVKNAFDYCVGSPVLGFYDIGKVQTCMGTINQQLIGSANAQLSDPAWQRAQVDLASAGTGGTSLGYALIKPNTPVSSPFLSYTIYASSLGIVRNTGVPKITFAGFDKAQIYRNEVATLTVLVKNIGSGSSDTGVTVSCSAPASYTQSQNAALAPGQEKSFDFAIQGASSTCQNSQCSVSVKDRNDLSGSASTYNLALSVCNYNQCNPDGTKQCAADRVQICQGGAWTDSQVCNAPTEFCDSGTYSCKTRTVDTTITPTTVPGDCNDRGDACWCQRYPTDPSCVTLCVKPAGVFPFNANEMGKYYGCKANQWIIMNQISIFLGALMALVFIGKTAMKFGVAGLGNLVVWGMALGLFLATVLVLVWLFSMSVIVGWLAAFFAAAALMVAV